MTCFVRVVGYQTCTGERDAARTSGRGTWMNDVIQGIETLANKMNTHIIEKEGHINVLNPCPKHNPSFLDRKSVV